MVTDKLTPALVSPNRGILAYHPRRYLGATADYFGQTVWQCPCCRRLIPITVVGRMEDMRGRAVLRYKITPFVLSRELLGLWETHLGRGAVWVGEHEEADDGRD